MEITGSTLHGRVLKFAAAVLGATALALLFGAVSATPAHADVSSIRVAGNSYNASEFSQLPSGVSFNSSTNTLTLTNANISNDAGDAICIYTSNADLVTVQVNGTNTLAGGLNYYRGLSTDGNLLIQGSGTLNARGHYGIETTKKLTIKGGNINTVGSQWAGIYAIQGVDITGGKVSASGSSYAIYAGAYGKIRNNYSHLGKISGNLSTGATFVSKGSKYRVEPYSGYVSLVKAKKKIKSMTVQSKSFGGVKYSVRAIKAKAFSGCKAKKITIGYHVRSIGKRAFYKTTKLKTLNLRKCNLIWPFSKKTEGISKKAFQKCGAKGGKKLTVKCGYSSSRGKKLYKKLLVKRGMSKKVKLAR
jgi:hypothetical protein